MGFSSRKCIVLSTTATLDSHSVISKFASPPPHATSAESGNMADTFDDVATAFDETGSLGYFIETQIAMAAKQSGIEIPDTRYPIGGTYDYPDLSGLKERLLEDDYIVLYDNLCRELNECANSDPAAIKKLLAKHSMKNKFAPDPTFATSPICITNPEFHFSIDL